MLTHTCERVDSLEDFVHNLIGDKKYALNVFFIKKIFHKACQSMEVRTRTSCAHIYTPLWARGESTHTPCARIEDYWGRIRHYLRQHLSEKGFCFVMDLFFADTTQTGAYFRKRFPKACMKESLMLLASLGKQFKKLRLERKPLQSRRM
jgi:hypothetical protein